MEEKEYSNLYKIVNIVRRQKDRADLEAVRCLLNDRMRLRTVAKEEPIFYIEDGKDLVYLVLRGSYINYRVSLNGKVNILGREKAPVWSGIDRAANASNINFTENKTMEECTVLEIDAKYFLEAVEHDGRFGLYIIKNILNKMTDISGKSDRLIFHDTSEHFAYFILKYWKDHHDAAGNSRIEMKNADLADEVEISQRSLYRIQNAWKNEGLISVKNGNIVVTAGQIRRLQEIFYWMIKRR